MSLDEQNCRFDQLTIIYSYETRNFIFQTNISYMNYTPHSLQESLSFSYNRQTHLAKNNTHTCIEVKLIN